MDDRKHKHYEINVCSFGLSDDAVDALFDRVAEAAHLLDEEVFAIGGYVSADECKDCEE